MEIWNGLVRNKDAGIVFSAALLFVGFSLSSESFFSAYNLFNISRIIAFSAFVAQAQAVVLVRESRGRKAPGQEGRQSTLGQQ